MKDDLWREYRGQGNGHEAPVTPQKPTSPPPVEAAFTVGFLAGAQYARLRETAGLPPATQAELIMQAKEGFRPMKG